jgi:DNA-binding PadR family transcriptional regulator
MQASGHMQAGPLVAELRQHARHRGFGPMGGPQGFGPGGPRGGRRRKRGEIRDAILHLLESRPMHGYEMIQEIEQRSDGRWTPSPGSVYPMLQLLEDEGLIAHEEQEGRKIFSLTTAGTAHVAEQLAEQTPPWEPRDGEADSPQHRMFSAGGQMMMAARQVVAVGDEAQVNAAVAVLEAARRELYGILAGAGTDE